MNRIRWHAALAVAALLLTAHCSNTVVIETVTVSSQGEWPAATTQALTKGAAFSIEVAPGRQWTSGSWTGTADGGIPQWGDYLLPGARAYSLIGRIGSEGDPFFVGTRYAGVADAEGVLELGMNDVPGTYWDNRGALTVEVAIH